MRDAAQFVVGLRNTWRVAAGLVVLLVGVIALQNPADRFQSIASAGGPQWIVDAYLVGVPVFAAVFVVLVLSSSAAIEDDANDVYHRLLVYPVSFPRVLLSRTLPNAACGTVAAAVVGTVALVSVPGARLTTVAAAIAIGGVATVPLAMLVSVVFLWVDSPRVGSLGVVVVIGGAVAVVRAGVARGVTLSPEATVAISLGAVGAMYVVTYLVVTRIDPERLVVR